MEPLTNEKKDTHRVSRSPRPIVVGVDGSPASQAALEWAAGQAAVCGAPLRVVHAIDAAESYASGRRIVEHATAVARTLTPDLTVRCATPMRSARVALVEESRHAQLLVIARPARGQSRVATHVAMHATCPVVLVSDPQAAASG